MYEMIKNAVGCYEQSELIVANKKGHFTVLKDNSKQIMRSQGFTPLSKYTCWRNTCPKNINSTYHRHMKTESLIKRTRLTNTNTKFRRFCIV